MKFIDLIDDCVFLILEHLDYGDLLNVAQINGQFSKLAPNVFLRKYSHLQVVINDMFSMPSNRSEMLNVAGMNTDTDEQSKGDDTDTIDEMYAERRINLDNLPPQVSGNQIEFFNGDHILKTFKHFGHLIKKIKTITTLQMGHLQSELIGKLISKFCSESLVDVAMEQNSEMLLKHIEKPLINVKTVSCQGIGRILELKDIRPTDLFPSLSRLYLHPSTHLTIAFFDYHMPHLEHVSLNDIRFQESVCLNIIMKNSQIRSLDLLSSKPSFLQKVNTHLPQLETLLYASQSSQDVAIQFENVTTFKLGYYTSPVNLHFPRLQTLCIGYHSKKMIEYGAFLNEHNHLTHLHLVYGTIEYTDFQRLIENQSDLVEITLDQNQKSIAMSTAIIVEFLRSHANVQQFNVINFHENQKVQLQEQLKSQWYIKINGEDIYFKRKTVT